ncbi:TGF-beta activated kinase-like protein [Saccoglossus kowalevskii]|uniref:Mitogen-activated protein kinase kinase kinase 7 n=1 Tax=Saccoglossus kowalevskii TaxID=10224 RepID=D1LXG1_SACKO|nr:TGF-beta activated kinase-like protein [Saccoglossus kowalevskii]ACY92667.1 TGF-beta activated kinase-like protein [Saccoglossus kowalevskii]
MSTAEAATQFVEEVDFSDLDFQKIVGRGSFGVVSRAQWKDRTVAVKMIETEAEIKAFLVEVRQLSRVNHPNIVKVYGACTSKPVCLVMEYADGGSLYNVLHGSPPIPQFTAAHAMSWALQCAKGVAYLHAMKPKSLIHRDLKPANLLLVAGGTTLKICDFGTACDIQTYMTNNKGSAAWMAPEVFEGSYYSEKCDVFSWGIILWEVLSRRKPFDEIGGPAFRIMWAVHNGTRPPLLKNLPKPIEVLMSRCWAKDPARRPSMGEVEYVMSSLMPYFKGADEPLVYPQEKIEVGAYKEAESNLIDWHTPITNLLESTTGTTGSKASTLSDTVIRKMPSTSVGHSKYFTQPGPAGIVRRDSSKAKHEYDKKRHSADLLEIMSQTSQSQQTRPSVQTHRRCRSHGYIPPQTFTYSNTLPASNYQEPSHDLAHAQSFTLINIHEPLTGYHSNFTNTATLPLYKRKRRTGTFVPGHRRSNSHGNIPPQTYTSTTDIAAASVATPPNDVTAPPLLQHTVSTPAEFGSNHSISSNDSIGSSASGTVPLHHVSTAPASLVEQMKGRSVSWEPPSNRAEEYIPMAYLTLDHHLQPLPPCTSSEQSMEVFDLHCKMAHEYLRVQTELALLHQRKRELANELDQDWKDQQNSSKILEDYTMLMEERESLLKIHKDVKGQLDETRQQQQRRPGSLVRR